jgi:methionyl-tRNA synthetase
MRIYHPYRFSHLTFQIDYSDEGVMVRYKKDLAGQLGNLIARSTAPALLPSGIVPKGDLKTICEEDKVLHTSLLRLPGIWRFHPCARCSITNTHPITDQFCERFENHEYGKALQAIFDVLAEVKQSKETGTIIYNVNNSIDFRPTDTLRKTSHGLL